MRSVLIVDDSKIIQKVVEKQVAGRLKVLGFANNGNEGFKMFQELKPDLVLLDITMPNCSGKECLRMIMEADKNANVIMVSGIGDDTTIKECLAMGAKGFVNKEHLSAKEVSASNPLIAAINSIFATLSLESA